MKRINLFLFFVLILAGAACIALPKLPLPHIKTQPPLEMPASVTPTAAAQPATETALPLETGITPLPATQTLTAPQTAYRVVDAGKLIGIITRGELLAALRRAGPEARLSQTVPPRFVVLGADDALADAQGRLQEHYAAVVVEAGRAVGLLSRADIARLAEVLDAHPSLLSKG